MSVDEILSAIKYHYEKIQQPPKACRMKSVAQECQRKIGSWRKALWLAGALGNERKRRLPQLKFKFTCQDWQITTSSNGHLKKLMYRGHHVKQKLKTH